MSRKINKIMRDSPQDTSHMDMCQGKALFEALQSPYNMNTIKGRSEIFKMLFDKKNGAIGGIYDDMKRFEEIYLNETLILKMGLLQLKNTMTYHHK